MQLEILVEENSAKVALNNLLPRLVKDEHSYRIITYQGKQDMLKKLPMTLKGYSKWMPEDMRIIILLDLDSDDCIHVKSELERLAKSAYLISKSENPNKFQIINRIAIHELETWFLGDEEAIILAYPKVKKYSKKEKFRNPDSIIDAWETLEKILQKKGYYLNGLRKIENSEKISKFMIPIKNKSQSFQVFWNGLISCLN